MPHLSPLKWLTIYSIVIMLLLLLFIKMNFLFNHMPTNYKKSDIKKKLYWKI